MPPGIQKLSNKPIKSSKLNNSATANTTIIPTNASAKVGAFLVLGEIGDEAFGNLVMLKVYAYGNLGANVVIFIIMLALYHPLNYSNNKRKLHKTNITPKKHML